MEKELERFAYWNDEKAEQVLEKYELTDEENDVYKIHVQKCGLCGS